MNSVQRAILSDVLDKLASCTDMIRALADVESEQLGDSLKDFVNLEVLRSSNRALISAIWDIRDHYDIWRCE